MMSLAAIVRIGTAASALLFSTVAALGTNYEHDAVTTYCWAIPKPTNMTKLTEDDRTPAFSTRAECPMVLTLSLPPVGTIHAFDQVNVTWTVQVDFSGANKINNTQLYYGPDKSGRMAQIVHSNIHSCVFGTGCDPFNDGKQLVDKTVNKIANFTDNKASFSDLLQFPEPGEYSVLAHIILPNFNASSRFDYAVYTKLTVLSATTPPPTPPPTAPIQTTATPIKTSGGSGLSQGATIAIVIGAIVVAVAVIVIVVLLRRRRDNQSSGYSQAPVQEAGYLGGHHSSNLGPMKPSELTDTNSTAGFQSAWGGHHGATGLDNTNQSSASSGSHGHPYSVPRPSDRRPNSEMHRPSDARSGSDVSQFSHPSNMSNEYFARPSSSQNPRKKRVDSDVEL